MIDIIIIEDEPIIAKDLFYTLKDLGYNVLAHCKNHEETFLALEKHQSDLVICDIDLGKKSWDGIQIAQEIRRSHDQPIIFLTALGDANTINRAATVDPDAYLIKPFEERGLFAAIELALNKYSKRKKSTKTLEVEAPVVEENIPFIAGNFFIKEKKRLIKVRAEDIYWVKADGAYSQLGTKNQVYLLSTNLGALEEKLSGHYFIRVHRSFLVNFQHIDTIEEDVLSIANEKIPMGKNYREEFYRRLQQL